jgi:hypothetical protein
LSKVVMPPEPEPQWEVDYNVPLPRADDFAPLPQRRPAEVIPFRPPPVLQGEVLQLRRAAPAPRTAAERLLVRELSPCPAISQSQLDQALRELRQATAQVNSQHVSVADGYRRYR